MASLNNEIRAFEEYLQHTKSEKDAVEYLMQTIRQIASQEIPNNPLVLRGSRDTGLANPLSDIDFNVQNTESDDSSSREAIPMGTDCLKRGRRALLQMKSALKLNSCFNGVRLNESRRLLILEAHHWPTGLCVQFLSRTTDYGGEYCKYYQTEYPQLRPLYILISYYLRSRQLQGPSTGGVSSYTIYTMILTALTHAKEQYEAAELGQRLIQVLEFWSKADLRRHGFAADPPRVFSKYSNLEDYSPGEDLEADEKLSEAGIKSLIKFNRTELKGGPPRNKLCLLDPADPFRDVGRGAQKMDQLQNRFQKTLGAISKATKTWDFQTIEERSQSINPTILLRSLVSSDWSSFCAARARLQKASPSWM